MNGQKLYSLFWALLLIMGISSCTSDEQAVIVPEGEKTTLQFPITRANEANEDRIINARIIVTNPSGIVIVNENTPIATTPHYVFEVEVNVGYMNVYLIANELSSWNLGSVANLSQLKAKIFDYNNVHPVVDLTHPIPMLGQYENVYVDEIGNVTLGGSLINLNDIVGGTVKRIFSKVTLDLTCLYSELVGGSPIQLDSVSVKSMPKESYFVPNTYVGNNFFRGAYAAAADYTTTATGFSGESYFYIPEYLLSDTSKYTYLSIVVNLVGGVATTQREYKVVIGDGIESKTNAQLLSSTSGRTVADLSVTRNTHYQYTIRVKSYNESSDADLSIVARIVDWNATTTDDSDEHEYRLTVSQSEITIPAAMGTAANPYTGTVTVSTDYPGGVWSVEPSAGVSYTVNGNTLQYTINGGSPPWEIKVKAGKLTKTIKITQ